MNWFKENKFVAGVLVVTVLGAGGLSYMLLGAKGKYDENAAAFQTQANELKRLETLPAYPDKENLQVSEEQRVRHLTMIADLQKNLAAAQFPVEPLAPNLFQDQLKAAVTQLTGKGGKMALPKGFYYGFETYQTSSAERGRHAPARAGAQGDSVDLSDRDRKGEGAGAKRRRLHARSRSRRRATRSPSRQGDAETGPAKPGPKPGATPAEPLVKPHSVDIVFTAEQRAVADDPQRVGREQAAILHHALRGAAQHERSAAPARSGPGRPGAPERLPRLPQTQRARAGSRRS